MLQNSTYIDQVERRLKLFLLHVLTEDDDYLKRLSTKPLLIPKLLSLISSEHESSKPPERTKIDEENVLKILKIIDYFPFVQPIEMNGIIENLTSISTYIILCLEKLTKISKCQRILRNHNGIPILLNYLRVCLQFESNLNNPRSIRELSNCSVYMNSSTNTVNISEECLCETKLVHDFDQDTIWRNTSICGILSQLAMNDFYAQIIARENGIHLIGSQLLIKYSKNVKNQCLTVESELKQTNNLENQQMIDTNKFGLGNIRHLYANAFCALRRLFISEHNRRLIKSFLPSSLLSELIEININTSTITNDYQKLVNLLESLNNEEYNELIEGIISCDVNRTPIHYVREYSILELLGTGAYGKVFKATKDKMCHNSYAIKKVSTSQIFFGRTSNERQKCIDRILNEVNVIRQQLRHPNIVRYYKTFLDSDHLYIVMELLDGVSLTELLISFKEKNIHFSESQIWNIFIQLILGLRYLHKEKKILHRDLSSNNIMISEGNKVTITDFGLAYHKTLNSNETKSTVGTLFYACPEMIQCLPYGEGADIWALGCILYQMCTFTSPFQGECILSTASRIVKGEYQSVKIKCPNQYSNLVDQIIEVCLKPDPAQRPDITGVATYLTSDILSQLDATQSKCAKIKGKLKEFQNTIICDLCCPFKHSKDEQVCEKHSTYINNVRVPDSNVEKISSTAQILPTVTINQGNLREINDPVLGMITVMHKLGYLSQESSFNNDINLEYEAIKYIVQSYRHRLFSAGIKAITVKEELFKLTSYCSDCINYKFLEINNKESNSSLLNILKKFSPDLAVKLDRNGYINYAILMNLIDLLLKQCTSYFS
ncbi:unnamed protein product [Schistosoma margrebowiei]|uniref:Protein kinase domain-containing protein n=2 Tax=Schistosoma margrebowiei TaxID=48269 RepID=A0AA84ZMZ8_9TREM|nr:unnamed protein product [Schistosoma margrebowiei]